MLVYVCVGVGDELPGGGSFGPQRFGSPQCPGEEPKSREDHRLWSGPSARYRRDGVSRRWREGEMEAVTCRACSLRALRILFI